MKDKFFAAIKQGDVNTVKQLLSKNKSLVIVTEENGRTGLHLAAFQGNEALVNLLLEKDAAIDARETKANATPLHMAVQGKRNAVVILLLQRKAQVNAAMQGNYTALHLAASAQDEALVSVLLQHGALAEARTDKQCTALHLAAQYGHVNVVKRLLEAKAAIEARQKSNWTPLHFAAQNGHDAVIRLFIACKANVNAVADNAITPLHLSAQNGRTSAVEILLAAGAAMDAIEKEARWTPLCMAVKSGHVGTVNFLLGRGASTQLLTKGGNTVLHLSALYKQPSVVIALLKNNLGLKDVTNSEGKTALRVAKEKGYQEIIQIIEGHPTGMITQSASTVSSPVVSSSHSTTAIEQSIPVGSHLLPATYAPAAGNNTNPRGFFQQPVAQQASDYLNLSQAQSHYSSHPPLQQDTYAGVFTASINELNREVDEAAQRAPNYLNLSQVRSQYSSHPPLQQDTYADAFTADINELNREFEEYDAAQQAAGIVERSAVVNANKDAKHPSSERFLVAQTNIMRGVAQKTTQQPPLPHESYDDVMALAQKK